jgi:hypothetical protein
MGVVPACLKERIMAVDASVHAEMFAVAEGQGAEIGDHDRYVTGRMALGALTELQSGRIIFVVACAA